MAGVKKRIVQQTNQSSVRHIGTKDCSARSLYTRWVLSLMIRSELLHFLLMCVLVMTEVTIHWKDRERKSWGYWRMLTNSVCIQVLYFKMAQDRNPSLGFKTSPRLCKTGITRKKTQPHWPHQWKRPPGIKKTTILSKKRKNKSAFL